MFLSHFVCVVDVLFFVQCHVSGFPTTQYQHSPQQERQKTDGRSERIATQALCDRKEEDKWDF